MLNNSLSAQEKARVSGNFAYWKLSTSVAIATTIVLSNSMAKAVSFKFNSTPDTPQEVIDGFTAAGDLWSSFLVDDLTVNIDIDFANLGEGILGGTISRRYLVDYDVFRSAAIADVTSVDDLTAVSHLWEDTNFDLLINQTSDNPRQLSQIPYLDDDGSSNNSKVHLTGANAKALGLDSLLPENAVDANITFSNLFDWDFDPSDGIDENAFDFISVAAHEIGHALGFISGVDSLDSVAGIIGPILPANFYPLTSMDLFRYSDLSTTVGNLTGSPVVDFRAGKADKYFSLDGGQTKIASFSTGSYLGDGQQASHWQDNLGIGIMDPTIDFGETPLVTPVDLQLFDVIGWDLASSDSDLAFESFLLPLNSVNSTFSSRQSQIKSVPESNSLWGLLTISFFSLTFWCKRKH